MATIIKTNKNQSLPATFNPVNITFDDNYAYAPYIQSGTVTFTKSSSTSYVGTGGVVKFIADGAGVNWGSGFVSPTGSLPTLEEPGTYYIFFLCIGSEVLVNIPTASTTPGNITPAAPTAGTVNDTTNTFTFTLSSGYAAGEHEYSLNNGSSWSDCTSNVITVGNVAIAIGALQVRVKAATGRSASAVLANAQAFTTVTDNTAPTVTSMTVDPGAANTAKINFSESMVGYSSSSISGLTLTGSVSGAKTISSVLLPASGTQATIACTTAFSQGETITIVYSGTTFEDVSGNKLAAFTSGQGGVPAVQNNLTSTALVFTSSNNSYTITGNTLTANSAQAKAIATGYLANGADGFIEFTIDLNGQAQTSILCFDKEPGEINVIGDTDHGIFMNGSGIGRILNGAYVSLGGTPAAGHILRLERAGSQMLYKHYNGTTWATVLTATAATTGILYPKVWAPATPLNTRVSNVVGFNIF